ncbi:MAG: hypothetical protein HZB72_10185 [Burkholderiales bacterium]|nr:hypothetical protein [Burkholderiales bacterium]
MSTSIFPHRPRLAAVALAGALAALCGPAAQAFDGIETFTSGTPFFKRVVTNTNPQTTSNTAFADLPGASTTIFVPPLTTALVAVGFDAETRCNGENGTQDWCEARILINGDEGSPQASTHGPDTFALDSTNAGGDGTGSWESHGFSRHRCIRNPGSAPLTVRVQVQWKVTNFGTTPPEFWLDDSTLAVQLSRDCTVTQTTPGGIDTAPAARALRGPQSTQE